MAQSELLQDIPVGFQRHNEIWTKYKWVPLPLDHEATLVIGDVLPIKSFEMILDFLFLTEKKGIKNKENGT